MALCGITAYYVWKYSAPRWRYLFFVPLAFGLVYALTVRGSLFKPRPLDMAEHCVVAFLFAFLIISLRKWDDSINRSKVLSPLRFCGERCYSLYLVHWPVVVLIGHAFNALGMTNATAILLITVPCCLATSLLLAAVFHTWVERRFWNPRINNPIPTTSGGVPAG